MPTSAPASDQPNPLQRTAFEIQDRVEDVAWQNRKRFARKRRQPWIKRLAHATAIEAYLLGLKDAELGRTSHALVADHLSEITAALAEEHRAQMPTPQPPA